MYSTETATFWLAGMEDRLADINDALRDPGVRAIFSTSGGKGAYRIAHALDFAAAVRDPKPLIGYSDITILHLALWRQCRLAGFDGPHVGWDREYYASTQIASPGPASMGRGRSGIKLDHACYSEQETVPAMKRRTDRF